MDNETVTLVLAHRQFLWGLVARAFAEEPDEAFAAVATGGHAVDEVTLVDDEHTEPLAKAYGMMATALTVAEPDLVDLRAAYTRLFVGPGTLACSPWETMHVTGRRTLFQPGVLAVREAYRAAGFLPARYPAVADDFIGLECDFLAKLAEAARKSFAAGDASRAAERLGQSTAFLDDHFLRWIDSLSAALDEHDPTGFYAAAAHFAATLARRDQAMIPPLAEAMG